MRSVDRQATEGNPIVWQGRSGRLYHGVVESLDQFSLSERAFHLLLAGARVLWVGGSAELIADPASRRRFRQALAMADSAIRLADPGDDSARLSILVDLEEGCPAPGPTVQAA